MPKEIEACTENCENFANGVFIKDRLHFPGQDNFTGGYWEYTKYKHHHYLSMELSQPKE